MKSTFFQQGFTLVELMMVVTLLGIMLALAIPGFAELIKNNRISAQVSNFHTALMMTRSEALKRVSRVTLCSSSNGTSCTTGGWEQGWIVFTDPDNDATVDGGETVLRIESALTDGNTLRGQTNVAAYVSYVGSGFTSMVNGATQNGDLVICDDRGFGSDARVIIIGTTGRPRVVKATDGAVSAASCTP